MGTQNSKLKTQNYRDGSVLALVVVCLVILAALGGGLLAIAYGVRMQAIRTKNEAVAMLAAEAGYEKAIFWMSQQQDMITALQEGVPGTSGSLQFADGDCDYNIGFFGFVKSRPVYRIISNGHSGAFNRTVDVLVVQAIGGWDMGMCRVPISSSTTTAVHYASGEIIDIPLHINNLNDNPDYKDIYISGSPQFLQNVRIGESRYTGTGSDKYSDVMNLFESGICFDQPDCKISNEAVVQQKVDRFMETTDFNFKFTPVANAPVTRPNAAVQLEFFVEDGIGKVRITNNCTVRGFRQDYDYKTYDFKVKAGSGGTEYERYDIYAYHLKPTDESSVTLPVSDTYVTQEFGGMESEAGGQIFVDGDVIIGGDGPLHGNDQVLQGKMTVVATGNIWVADSITVNGDRDGDMPARDNPNILGLVAQGVIKVVDPGMTDDSVGSVGFTPDEPDGFEYVPIGRVDTGEPAGSHKRHLPDPMIAETAITIGGGGWGAENVRRGSYGDRKEEPGSGSQDYLILRGTITEVIRGVVGLVDSEGYTKRYYLDKRLLEGILPGDIWLTGKYIPTPAGWHDYRPSN